MIDEESEIISLKERIKKVLPIYIDEIFFNKNFNRYNNNEAFQVLLTGPYVCKIKKDSSLDVDNFSTESAYCKYMLLVKNIINKLSQNISFTDARKFLTHEMERGITYDYGVRYSAERFSEGYKKLLQQLLDILRFIQLDMKCLPTEHIPPITVIASKMETRVGYLSDSLYRQVSDLVYSTDNYKSFSNYIDKLVKDDFSSLFYSLERIFWEYQFILQLFYEPIGDKETSKFLGYLKTLDPNNSTIQTVYSVLCYIFMRKDELANDREITSVIEAGLEPKVAGAISVESLFKAFETSAMTGGPRIVPYQQTLRKQGSIEPNIFSKMFNSEFSDNFDKSIESLKEKYKFN